MTVLNISKRSIFKRRRDGQANQGGDGSVAARSVASPSSSEFNLVILQDYAKKVGGNLFKGDQNFEDNINVAKKLSVASLAIGGNDFDPNNIARTTVANAFQVDQTINADLYINGNIIQNGSAYVTHAEQVEVEDNLMKLNVGEPGSQITGFIPGTSTAFSGIEINRGSGEAYYFGVVEGARPLFKLGKKNSLVTLAAREDSPMNNGVMLWDDANHRMKAVMDLSIDDLTASGNIYAKKGSNAGIVFDKSGSTYSGMRFTTDGKLRWIFSTDNADNANDDTGGYFGLWAYNNDGSYRFPVVKMYRGSGDLYAQGQIFANGKTVWNAGNSNKDNTSWQALDLTAHRNLFALGDSDLQGNVYAHGHVGSPDYASGLTGADWRMTKSGDLELDNVEIRKGLTVHEIIVARERSVNGGIITSVANGTIKSVNNDVITLKGHYNSFVIGDRVRMQEWENSTRYFEAEVTAVNDMTITLGNYTTAQRPQANDDLVQWGHINDASRQNFLYQTARGSNAAYFSVLHGVNSSSLTDKEVLRMGNLGGYANDGFGIASKYGGKTYFELSNTNKSISGFAFTDNAFYTQMGSYGDNVNIALSKSSIGTDSALHPYEGLQGLKVTLFKSFTGNSDRAGYRAQVGALSDDYFYRNTENGKYGFEFVGGRISSKWGNVIFRAGADKATGELDCSIAGIAFDNEKLSAGNVQIWKDGKIINTALGTPYAFYNSGDFSLGKGQLTYDVVTNKLSLGADVSLTWDQITDTSAITTGISNAQNAADNAYDLADTKVTNEQATTITKNTITSTYIKGLDLEVGNQILMGANAEISFNKVTDKSSFDKMVYNPDFSNGKEGWTTVKSGQLPVQATNGDILSGQDGATGAVWELTGVHWLYYRNPIKIRPGYKYRLRYRRRQTVENGSTHTNWGYAPLDKDFNLVVWNVYQGATYPSIASGWDEEILEMTYDQIKSGDRSATEYIRPMFIVNYQGEGTAQVDYLIVEEVSVDMVTTITQDTVTTTYINTMGIDASAIKTGKLVASQIDFDNAAGSNVWLSGRFEASEGAIGAFNIGSTGMASTSNTIQLDANNATMSLYRIVDGQGASINFGTKAAGTTKVVQNNGSISAYNSAVNEWRGILIDGYNLHFTADKKMYLKADEVTWDNGVNKVAFQNSSSALIPTLRVRGYGIGTTNISCDHTTHTGSGTKYMTATNRYQFFSLTANCTVYLPTTSGVRDGTEIVLVNLTNYDANIKARSGASWAGSTTRSLNLNDIYNTMTLVKKGSEWIMLDYNNNSY